MSTYRIIAVRGRMLLTALLCRLSSSSSSLSSSFYYYYHSKRLPVHFDFFSLISVDENVNYVDDWCLGNLLQGMCYRCIGKPKEALESMLSAVNRSVITCLSNLFIDFFSREDRTQNHSE